MNGIDYPDDYGASMSLNEFYQKQREGATPTTSQVNAGEYIDFWTPFFKAGKDIIHVTLSSGISGTYNSACVAAAELKEIYPDRKIYVMDSLCASSGYGLLMEELADKRDSGFSFDKLTVYGENLKLNINHWVFTSDLSALIRGGRVSAAAGTVASILNICPIINVNSAGKLVPVSKVRTKKKVYQEIVKIMEDHAEDGLNYKGRCYITHSDCPEDAEAVKKKIEATFSNLNGKVDSFRIGTTIGAHTGVATVALFFIGDKRTS